MEIHTNGIVIKFSNDGYKVLAECTRLPNIGTVLPPIELKEKYVVNAEILEGIERTFGRITARIMGTKQVMRNNYPRVQNNQLANYQAAIIMQQEDRIYALERELKSKGVSHDD